MKNIFLKISSICFLVLFSCKQEDGLQTDLYAKIDVNERKEKIELILQDIFDIEYIPLETTDESLTFGFVKSISDEFIIAKNANFRDGDLFVFDGRGKFIRKINHKGNANGEYIFTTQVFFDDRKKELYVSCIVSNKTYVYDVFGNFKRSFKFQERKNGYIIYNPMYRFDQEHLICCDYTNGRWITDGEIDLERKNIFHIISDEDGHITEEIILPYNKTVSQVLYAPPQVGIVRNDELYPYNGQWILADPSSDTIYVYTKDKKMKPLIVRTPSVQSMSPEIFLFPGVITNKYLFIQAVKKEFNNNSDEQYEKLTKMNWVYDTEKNKTFEYKIFNNDFCNKRTINNLSSDILNLFVVNSTNVAFAERLEASELVELYKKGLLRGELNEIAANLKEDSNPVILLAKHRE